MVDNAGTSAQRIRIGLTGLAFAFLLVLLGSVISRSGSDDGPASAAEQAQANAAPSEPLAELGVAPGADSQSNNSSSKP
jgi:hypothetical protein